MIVVAMRYGVFARVFRLRLRGVVVCLSALGCAGSFCVGQGAACPAIADAHSLPAEMAYAQGNMEDAELLYKQAVAQHPGDDRFIAGLARTELRLGEVAEAGAAVRAALGQSPRSLALLTTMAEVQLREGQPWLARETLDRAAAVDACYARIWMVRSRIDRLDSMYATERSEIARAYAIDPNDAEIRRAWNGIVTPANETVSTEEYLASGAQIDPEARKAAEATVKATLPLFSETSQTCQGVPTVATASLPLVASRQDGNHIDGYRTEVGFGQSKAMLGVDTAASGFYISRALADANNLTYRTGDPPETVHADAVQLGPLTFHDCVVGVSDAPFPGKAAGFLGTDLFERYLVTLNFSEAKLLLQPLPAVTGVLPGDRVQAPELRGFSPVYHRLQYLLVPVLLNAKERRLFVLDSGIRLSTMTLPVAHSVSSTQRSFTNPLRTVSGVTLQVYRDGFDLQFADLLLRGRTGILQFDPKTIERHAGMEIGGMLGFDILHAAVLQLDYRDGLVKIAFPDGEAAPALGGTTLVARGSGDTAAGAEDGRAACTHQVPAEVPASATIETSNTGLWDSAHMKTGEKISVKVTHPWAAPNCRLEEGSNLYGHVTEVSLGKGGGQPRLGFAFDGADCSGSVKKELPFKVISVVAAPGEFVGMHSMVPTSVGGGRGRQITDAAANLDRGDDQNLNPEKDPGLVQTGSVRGLPALRLKPDGGPACSTLLTSTGPGLRLGVQTRFIVVMQDPGTAK